jgi:cell wall-associated NlpC family hydrolase
VSGRAGVAVQTARAQIGDPYVWGATGPDSFDCSGLTSYAWKAAGVILPRTSREQYAAGVKVARSTLRPGDLVYFGSPIYHVALYIGNNMMISAPQPGDVVKYQSLDAFSDYAGATRPG